MTSPTPEDFFSETPPSRTIGIECEYNIQLKSDSSQRDYITKSAIAETGHRSVKGHLDNGFHFYIDVSHIELDTPECLGPREAAVADLAGILLLQDVVRSSGRPHKGVHRHTATVIGGTERTSGYHENYLIPREIASYALMDTVMASHLTSRIWSGAGLLGQNGFELWQKLHGIGGKPITRQVERRTDHGNKPMGMIPPAGSDTDTIGDSQWARLEVRFADAGISPYARYLTFAATSLVLRLIEHSHIVDIANITKNSFVHHTGAARAFSRDLSFGAVAETESGAQISAVDYQQMLANAAQELSERIELPEDERMAINLWLGICDELKKANLYEGNYGKLLGLLDFAPRHRYLSRRFPDNLTSHNKEARGVNLAWDMVLPEGGAIAYWDEVGQRFMSYEEIENMLSNPPNTRASMRGQMIAEYDNHIDYATWSALRLKNGSVIHMNDPYASAETLED